MVTTIIAYVVLYFVLVYAGCGLFLYFYERRFTPNDYLMKALRTVNWENQEYPKILDGLMGLCGESGECIDILKKVMFQGHKLDAEHLKEELGDVAWYLALSSYAVGYDLESVMKANIEKLQKRYPEGFETEKSVNRVV